jgi:hypothetical protein
LTELNWGPRLCKTASVGDTELIDGLGDLRFERLAGLAVPNKT